jgi:hypothetical protein
MKLHNLKQNAVSLLTTDYRLETAVTANRCQQISKFIFEKHHTAERLSPLS